MGACEVGRGNISMCRGALEEQQLEAAIDRILVQSHPDNLSRRDGRKPRYELPTALIIASDLFKEGPDARLKLARDQADLLTKGYLEVADDYWANLADGHAVGTEEWKKTGLRTTDFGMDDSYHENQVYHHSKEEEEEEDDDDNDNYGDACKEEYEMQQRMHVKVMLSTLPEAAVLEPQELEAAIDRILNPTPTDNNLTRMTITDIRLVLAHKRKELDEMEMEEFQAKVCRDFIAKGYVEVDQEYWAKMEPSVLWAVISPGCSAGGFHTDTQLEEDVDEENFEDDDDRHSDDPLDLEKDEEDDSFEQQEDEDDDNLVRC
ncbi:hypothetical protein ACQ4PT_063408 [Festuca glaucescens]